MSAGPIINRADIYWELTFPFSVISFPFNSAPLMRRGGYPSLQLMQDFGAKAAWTSPNSISVAPQLYQSIPFKVESDWSAASYWYQIAALSPKAEIELLGLFPNSYQGGNTVSLFYFQAL